ncbi:MAG: ATP-binding protein [Alphaproteobacteria bacterium]|nr:ATP-binding protein [Alphaproteobacteria bacterium]
MLPYGREDNDFLEIEFRRSLNAGRHFWNHRQMFGRIAITRNGNPNLRDKAGREGFIDNTAAKTFKELVVNILELSARRYFGSYSEIRKPRIAEIKQSRAATRAAADRRKLQARERKLFQKELDLAEKTVPALLEEIRGCSESIRLENDSDVTKNSARVSGWRDALSDAAVRDLPKGLKRLGQRNDIIRKQIVATECELARFERRFQDAVAHYAPKNPKEVVTGHARDAVFAVRRQIDGFRSRIQSLQRDQFSTVNELTERRVQGFQMEARALVERHAADGITFAKAVSALKELRSSWTSDNRDILGVYVSALETVREQIDLETLASVQVEDLREVNAELDRLTALAQLGIAVEIAAHDLSDFDAMISSGMHALPEGVRDTKAVQDIRLGVDGLTDQLRFLSPLRLSGDRIPRWINGAEIERFMREFFAPSLARSGIAFSATEAFRAMRVFERPARVFPVFMNIINNSIYWVATGTRDNRLIVLDMSGTDAVVADSGPGVASEDVSRIFTLFFTRKQRSGRGVGLYLARANLAAGGHSIRYRAEDDDLPLNGAAFLIGFRGVEAEGVPEA